MKLFKHVFYSWALAIVMTLAGLSVFNLAIHSFYLTLNSFRFQFVVITFGAFVVAIPSLFISVLFFRFIYSSYYTVNEKFLLWNIAAIVSVILNIFFIPLIFSPDLIGMDLIIMLWPAYAGLVLSLSLRYRYFLLLFLVSRPEEQVNSNPDIKI